MLRFVVAYSFTAWISATRTALVVVRSGVEQTGVDLQLQPAATVRVAGTLLGSFGAVPTAMVRLLPSGFKDVNVEDDSLFSVTDDAGHFVFPAVPVGEYTLRASARVGAGTGLNDPMHFADMPVSAAPDASDVVALLRPGITVTGRFEFDGKSRRADRRPAP